MKNENKYAAPALDKGLDILEYLSSVGIPQSQVEIAEALERTATEIFRMLARLEYRGYIIRDPLSGKYQLSLKLYHLSRTHSPVESLRRSALGPMQDLAGRIGHPTHLSIVDGDSLLVVAQARSTSPVSISIAEGSRFPLINTTSGVLLLASLPKDQQSAKLSTDAHFQSWSDTDQKAYLGQLEEISQNGYNFADSQITQGVTDIAARIGEGTSPILASIAVSCVSSTLGNTQNDRELLLKETLQTAKQIATANGLSQ